MKRIIKVTKENGSHVNAIMKYDNDITMLVSMTRDEYELQIALENIFDTIGEKLFKKIESKLNDIEYSAYRTGYDSGYDSGYEQAKD